MNAYRCTLGKLRKKEKNFTNADNSKVSRKKGFFSSIFVPFIPIVGSVPSPVEGGVEEILLFSKAVENPDAHT